MTDTLTVGNITQLVQPAGRVAWFPPMERNEFTFVVQLDPRDARIAELEIQCGQWVDAYAEAKEYEAQREEMFLARIAQLEAALREIRERTSKHNPLSIQDVLIMRAVDAVLPRPPEGDMRMTVEEWEA